RRMQEIQRMTSRERPRRLVRTYRALIRVTEHVVTEARTVVTRTERVRGLDPGARGAAEALRAAIAHHCTLADRVLSQTRRRVLPGPPGPTPDKPHSIFQPPPDLITP